MAGKVDDKNFQTPHPPALRRIVNPDIELLRSQLCRRNCIFDGPGLPQKSRPLSRPGFRPEAGADAARATRTQHICDKLGEVEQGYKLQHTGRLKVDLG